MKSILSPSRAVLRFTASALVLSGFIMLQPAANLWAQAYGDPNQPYDRLPGTYETYHVKWLKPFAGGKLKVLFIISYPQSREVIETAQRLDLDYTVIMCSGHKSWSSVVMDASGGRQLRKPASDMILRDLVNKRLGLDNRYDAIVIGKVGWPVIPPEVRELILKHVERGTGLVYICPNRLLNAENTGWAKKTEYAKDNDPEFSKLFETPDPALAGNLLKGLPMDVLPLNPIEAPDKYSPPPGVPAVHSPQRCVCITSSTHGKGRIIGVDYFDEIVAVSAATTSLAYYVNKYADPSRNFDRVMYDYAFALLGRCIIASCGKAPAIDAQIKFQAEPTALTEPVNEVLKKCSWSYKKSGTVIDRASLDKARAQFVLGGVTGTEGALALAYQVRNLDGEILKEGELKANSSGKDPVAGEIPLPVLARGTYLLDLRVLDTKKQVVTFASASFRIESAQVVKTLKTEKDRYQDGEIVNCEFELERELGPNEKVEAWAADTWGRTVAIGPVAMKEDGKSGAFKITVHQPLSRIWDIFCAVKDPSGAIDVRKLWIGLPDWKFDDYVVLLELMSLPGEAGWKGAYWSEVARKYGVNAAAVSLIYDRVWQYESVERAHYKNVTYADHLGQQPGFPPYDKEASGRCFSEFGRMCRSVAESGKMLDPKEFPYQLDYGGYSLNADWINKRIKSYLESARFGSPYYVLTGENYLSGEMIGQENTCFCPLCTSRFREWCRKQYGNDLGALNREWGSDLKSWDDVRGILLMEAAMSNQLPRWVDFRYFMRSEVWTQFFIDWTDMMRRFIPEFRSGHGGHDLHDFTKYRKHMTASKVYGFQDFNSEWKDIMQSEVIQSFAVEKPLVISSIGVSADLYDLRTGAVNERIPWRALFMGFYGFDWERGFLAYYDCLGGDSSMTPDLSEPMPFFKNIGREVMFIQKGIGKLTLAAAPYRSKVAVLWAPYNHYISRLEPFQKRGFSGSVTYNVQVTDGAPADCLALMQSLRIRPLLVGPEDVTCGMLEKKGFKALLLPYSKGISIAEAEAIRSFVKNGGVVIADNTPGVYSEHGKKLDEPRLRDLFPDLTKECATPYGKGRAVYLPGGINCYVERFDINDFSQAEKVATVLKEAAGVVPPVEVAGPGGVPRRDTLMPLFIKGSTQLLGLMRASSSTGETEMTTVKLDKSYYVWDVRKQTCLGNADNFTVTLDHHAFYYALLPVQISGMKLSGTGKVKGGQNVVLTGQVRFGEGDQKAIPTLGQAVHLEVKGPDGQELECFRRNILFDGEKFEVALPISYSEKPGEYTVEATHAITGMKATAVFKVK